MDVSVLVPTLGTVSVAALGLWAQNRRAHGEAAERQITAEREVAERRDAAERAAAERRDAAAHEAEVARRTHLLDERRTAYLELATATAEWIDRMDHRARLGLKGGTGVVRLRDAASDESGRVRVARAAGIARLVGPTAVVDAAQELVLSVSRCDADAKVSGAVSADLVDRAHEDFDGLLDAMERDLRGSL